MKHLSHIQLELGTLALNLAKRQIEKSSCAKRIELLRTLLLAAFSVSERMAALTASHGTVTHCDSP